MSFVPAFDVVANPVAGRVLFFLHGILGNARNVRGIAERLGSQRSELRIVTVDLRNHARSRPAPAPHRLSDCAGDLHELGKRIGMPTEIIGHSFGGKVALAYAERHGGFTGLETVWSLDSPPGPGPATAQARSQTEIARVLEVIRGLPRPLSRRAQVTEELLHNGIDRSVAQWAASLAQRAADGKLVLTFDLPAVETMLEDYWSRDFTGFLENVPGGMSVHLVRALDSRRWNDSELALLELLRNRPRVHVHELPRAGHWLHVDQPEGLLALIHGQDAG